jgi:Domain of unknown function (DUF222)
MFEEMFGDGEAGASGLAAVTELAAAADLFAAAGVDLVGVDLGLLQPAGLGVSPLAWLDPARPDLGDDALIELGVVACRLEGWAGAVKARAALALTRAYEDHLEVVVRAAAQGSPADPDLAASVATAEVGCATAHSPSQVQRWVDLAGWLERVPSANTDFVSGRLGWGKAAAFGECAASYGSELAEVVYRAERDRTLVRTSSQMRVRWNRALAKADPDVMREQAERAHTARGVQVLTRGQAPGMAALLLTGAAPLVLAAKARLDDLADTVRAGDPGDPRTLDAIRIDAALDLLLHGHLTDHERGTPTGPDASTGQGDSTHSTRSGGSTGAGGSARSGGSRGRDEADCPSRPSRVPVRRRPAVVVTVPLSVLTGASQEPAVLAGYGPIPAQLAREVAADAVWRCAVIDDDPTSPTHRALLALGRTTYTPNYVPGTHTRRPSPSRHQRPRPPDPLQHGRTDV